jgi:SCP-2 sterol transfer family
MVDRTAEFFDTLALRGHERRLAKVAGMLRFDLERDGRSEYWFVDIRRGDINAWRAPEPRPADCILRTSHAWFDRFVAGVENVLPALLRADAVAEGNLQLIFALQRLMPDPPGARDPRDLRWRAGEGR